MSSFICGVVHVSVSIQLNTLLYMFKTDRGATFLRGKKRILISNLE